MSEWTLRNADEALKALGSSTAAAERHRIVAAATGVEHDALIASAKREAEISRATVLSIIESLLRTHRSTAA